MKKRELSTKKGNRQPKIEVSITLFQMLTAYLFTDYMERGFVRKLDIFFRTVDTSVYSQDNDIQKYYIIIRHFIKKVVEEEIYDPSIILDFLHNIPKYKDEIDEAFNDVSDIDLDKNEALYVENEFISRLNYVRTLNPIHRLKEALHNYEKGEYESYDDIISQIRESTLLFNKEIVAKNSNNLSTPDIDFKANNFDEVIKKVHKNLKNPKRFIKTGIKRLNDLLGGGFQPGRIYVFLGLTGGFKSAILLNSIFWSVKYNDDVECNDQGRKPMVLYLTMENDLDESIERTFAYVGAVDNNGDTEDNFDNAFQKLTSELTVNSNWGISYKFRPKYSITPSDFDSIISELEADGEYEVKLVVFDYLKRINPDIPTGDRRVDLGEVVNDFSLLCKRRKIALVTANQMNASAYKKLEESEKLDKAKDLSMNVISESQLIAENADSVIAINKEYLGATNEHYLTFKDLKQRSRKKNVRKEESYFAHPFEEDNAMRLKEDVLLKKSLSRKLISDELSTYDPNDNVVEEDVIIQEVNIEEEDEPLSLKKIGMFDEEFMSDDTPKKKP